MKKLPENSQLSYQYLDRELSAKPWAWMYR